MQKWIHLCLMLCLLAAPLPVAAAPTPAPTAAPTPAPAATPAATPTATPANAQAWVARVIAAYGGRSVLEKVHSLVYKGRIVALLGGEKGTVTISLQRPRQLRTVIDYRRYTEQRIVNGQHVWRSFGGDFREATGPARLADIYQYQHLDLPMGLLDSHYTITLGEKTAKGKTWPVLHLQDKGGPPMLVTLDPETALIRRVAGIFHIQGKTTRLAVEYSDYRKEGGIPLPHTLVNFAGGVKIAKVAIDRVQVNAPLQKKLFHP